MCWSTNEPSIVDSKTTEGAGTGSYASNLSDLNAATMYYVRAYATNSAGTGYGIVMSFTTLGQAPSATTQSATNVTSTSATLNGVINANYLSTTVTFEYGTTTSYGQIATASPSPITENSNTNVTAEITGLKEGTIYHFRAKTVNSLGTTNGNDISFTTLGQAPTAITQSACCLSSTGAKLNGIVNANYISTSVTFEYGTTTAYGSSVEASPSPVTGNTNTNVSANLTRLMAGTTYHFRIKVVNSLGTTYGNNMSFTTILSEINGNICVMGNSTITAWGAYNSVASYLSYKGTLIDISGLGDKINTQKTKWDALDTNEKLSLEYVFLQIGLNDLDPSESASTTLSRYQTLVNTINADAPFAKLILGTMIPCKQRLLNVYGAANGLIAYQKWLDMNEAIKGNGVNAIIGMVATASIHTDSLNDGDGNLDDAYDIGDGIHPNNAGRIIIADSWMTTYELLSSETVLLLSPTGDDSNPRTTYFIGAYPGMIDEPLILIT